MDGIRRLIVQGRFDQVLESFRDFALSDSELETLTAINGRIADLRNKVFRGLLSEAEESIEKNKVRNSILEFLTTIDNRIETNEKADKIIYGKDLNPSLLLKARAKKANGFREDYYYDRTEVDNRLKYFIENRRSVIIIGKALAGKTRAIYHLFKNTLIDHRILIVESDKDLELGFKAGGALVIIIDDIEKYLLKFGTEILREVLLEPDKTLVCTVRAIHHHSVRKILEEISESFSFIDIRHLSEKDKKEIRKDIKPSKQAIDNTIGSFFLPLSVMEYRYNNLISRIEKEILRAYYASSLYILRRIGEIPTIKDFVHRRYQNHYGEFLELTPFEWEKSFDNLEDLGFITNRKVKSITVEEAYFTTFIKQDFDQRELIRELIQYYPEIKTVNNILNSTFGAFDNFILDECNRHGLQENQYTYTIRLKYGYNANLYKDVFRKLCSNLLSIDTYLANTLLEKVKYSRDLVFSEVLGLIEKSQVDINAYSLFLILKQSENFHDRIYLFNKWIDKVKSTVRFSNISPLLNSGINSENISTILKLVDQHQIVMDGFSYSNIISKCEIYEQAVLVKEHATINNVRFNTYSYTALMKLSPSLEESLLLLSEMESNKVKPTIRTYNNLINNCTSLEIANGLLRKAISEGLLPNTYTYNILIGVCGDFKLALSILNDMLASNIKPNVYTLQALVKLAKDFEEILFLLKKLPRGASKSHSVRKRFWEEFFRNVDKSTTTLLDYLNSSPYILQIGLICQVLINNVLKEIDISEFIDSHFEDINRFFGSYYMNRMIELLIELKEYSIIDKFITNAIGRSEAWRNRARGHVSFSRKQFERASEYYKLALIEEKSPNGKSALLSQIGLIYFEDPSVISRDYALKCLESAYKLNKKVSSNLIALLLLRYFDSSYELINIDSANLESKLEEYNMSVSVFKKRCFDMLGVNLAI